MLRVYALTPFVLPKAESYCQELDLFYQELNRVARPGDRPCLLHTGQLWIPVTSHRIALNSHYPVKQTSEFQDALQAHGNPEQSGNPELAGH